MAPRLSDLQAALRKDDVAAQIRRSKFDYRKRLYMITGVRIARGARLSRKDSKTRDGNAKAMVDLVTVSVVPLKVGPKVEVTRENEGSYSFKEVSDFFTRTESASRTMGKMFILQPMTREIPSPMIMRWVMTVVMMNMKKKVMILIIRKEMYTFWLRKLQIQTSLVQQGQIKRLRENFLGLKTMRSSLCSPSKLKTFFMFSMSAE
jgi:hypothetical protein